MSQQVVKGRSYVSPGNILFCYLLTFFQKPSHYFRLNDQTNFIKFHPLGRLQQIYHHLGDFFSDKRNRPLKNIHEVREEERMHFRTELFYLDIIVLCDQSKYLNFHY